MPVTVKRMLQGQKISWESYLPTAQSSFPTANTPFLQNTFQVETDNAGASGGGGGVYKDRARWLAVLYVSQGAQGRHYLLGRFESEEEANAAYKWVGLVAVFHF